jgi:hypothetical protein
MSDFLTRAWRWRLRTRKDLALFTVILVGLGLINLAIFSAFSIAGVVTTVLGVTTGCWIVSRLLSPK